MATKPTQIRISADLLERIDEAAAATGTGTSRTAWILAALATVLGESEQTRTRSGRIDAPVLVAALGDREARESPSPASNRSRRRTPAPRPLVDVPAEHGTQIAADARPRRPIKAGGADLSRFPNPNDRCPDCGALTMYNGRGGRKCQACPWTGKA